MQLPKAYIHAFCRLALLLLLTAGFAATTIPSAASADLEFHRVLVLNSYHQGYAGTDDLVEGIMEVIGERHPDAEIRREYLDSKFNSGPEYERALYELMSSKYSAGHHLDLVITTDDAAFNFVESNHDKLFKGIPVVFCGTNAFDPRRLDGHPVFFGVDERPSFGETIELALELLPDTKRIVAIHDDSVTGRLNSGEFRRAANEAGMDLQYEYWSGLEYEELSRRIRELPDDTVAVYFASFVKRSTGERFDSSAALRQLAQVSPVPILGGWEFSLGNGIIGGKLVNLVEHGALAGNIASDLLDGVPAGSIPRLWPSPNLYMFDYTELRRHKVPLDRLPAPSVIINRPPSFFERNQTAIFTTTIALMALLVAVSFVALYRSRNRLAQAYQAQIVVEKELVEAIGEIKTLRGIIPICSICKQIRDDEGAWARLEEYLSKHSEAQFSHGLCPECYKKEIEELEKL